MCLRALKLKHRTRRNLRLQRVHQGASPPPLAPWLPAPRVTVSFELFPRTEHAHFAGTITAATYIRPTTHGRPTASSNHRYNRIDDCRITCCNILTCVILLASHQSHVAFPPPTAPFLSLYGRVVLVLGPLATVFEAPFVTGEIIKLAHED